MRHEIRTWRFRCDFCGAVVCVEGTSPEKPAGWTTVTSHGWGMTDYSKTEDRCPECTAKGKDRK
jgi:hypothetical protein